MSCWCCEKINEQGDFKYNACCDNYVCEHEEGETDLSNCIHCGAEMFQEQGFWFHHEQRQIPYNDRGVIHI